MRASGEYSIADLMEVFSVGRATVYRVLDAPTLCLSDDDRPTAGRGRVGPHHRRHPPPSP
jgi:hypothetical protein